MCCQHFHLCTCVFAVFVFDVAVYAFCGSLFLLVVLCVCCYRCCCSFVCISCYRCCCGFVCVSVVVVAAVAVYDLFCCYCCCSGCCVCFVVSFHYTTAFTTMQPLFGLLLVVCSEVKVDEFV